MPDAEPGRAGEEKEFGIGAVLSITDGKMVCDIGEIYGILGWMTGESLMTHQLPRASRECEGPLREQFPELGAVTIPDGLIHDWDSAYAYLATLYPRFGATVQVAPLNPADHTRIDPLTELHMIRPDLPVIAVQIDPSEPTS